MSDKIKTSDCVKAITDYWQDAIDHGRTLSIIKYHGASSDLVNPRLWKRVKKLGNAKDGFIRLFANVVVDQGCAKAGREAAGFGRVDLSARIKWVMVVRATDDKIYDVCAGATFDGEFLEPADFEAKVRALCPVYVAPSPKPVPKDKDEEVRERLTKVLGFRPASYEERWGSEPPPIDDEEAWEKVYGEDYKKFPIEFGQPVPPADPLVPGGAIHLNVDKKYPAIERSSRKYIKFMEAKYEHRFSRKKIKPGAVFLFLSPDDAQVEDVLTFPKGGVAYIDSEDGPFPDYGAVDNLFLEDDVGNVWLAGDEPQDDTKTVDECWSGEDLKRAKDAIAKYGATVVMRHM